jgi:ElaA protein
MDPNKIFIKSFAELTTKQLFDIYKLRSEIFILEQNCVYQDVDNFDLVSIHVCMYEGETLLSYCRIIPPSIYKEEPVIGRVVTLISKRGNGYSKLIIQTAIDHIQSHYLGSKMITITAQFYLLKFYQSFGFVQTSEVFLEDGIEHIHMRLQFKD